MRNIFKNNIKMKQQIRALDYIREFKED